ncbi:Uncharacterised protein [Vibrio cholerae]|nr:Uncharacterised protein [Vibrio cholerae]CSD72418.1 Uncharacterised protein [Vibrio cholerae]
MLLTQGLQHSKPLLQRCNLFAWKRARLKAAEIHHNRTLAIKIDHQTHFILPTGLRIKLVLIGFLLWIERH